MTPLRSQPIHTGPKIKAYADGKGTPGVAANDKWQTWVDEVRNQVK